MIFVRTNSKYAIALVIVALVGSIFTIWRVNHNSDKLTQQGIELQQQAAKITQQAAQESALAAAQQ